MISRELVSILIVLVWMMIAVMSYEFYTTTKENRFRFRYWFAIGMLNMFQAFLGMVVIYSDITDYQIARWVAFVLIDALFLEMFIFPVARRKKELFIRTFFYFNLVLDFMTPHPYFLLLNIIVLFILARMSTYYTTKTHFSISMILYGAAILIPYLTAYTQLPSLITGLIFSLHSFWGVSKLYKEEQTNELIKEEMLDKVRRKEYEKNKSNN